MKNWKMREIVVMSVISVVFAVIYLVSTHASNIAAGFFGRMWIGLKQLFGMA